MADAASERPVLMVADDDAGALERVAEELERRYGAEYRVLRVPSAEEADARLRQLARDGEELALLLVGRCREGPTAEEVLARSRDAYPGARRGLLIDWGDWGDPSTAEVIRRAMALGHMDYYVLRPWRSPDEYFHRTISDFLHEWWRGRADTPSETTLVAERWSPRAHELRSLLARNGIPHAFHDPGSGEGARLLVGLGRASGDAPLMLTVDGQVLVDPSNAEVARAVGVTTALEDEEDFDLVVVGAGPAGLSAGVYGASEGLRTLVVEGESIGGQAGSSARIRNYLGFPRGISGSGLAQQAYQQAWTFGTRFLFMRRAEALGEEGGRHLLTMSDGSRARARAVVLAIGVTYRRVGIESLERLAGAGVFYGSSASEAPGLAGERVYVVGGGNSAGQAVVHLARYAADVTLLVRTTTLAESMSRYLIDEMAAARNVTIRYGTEVVGGGGEGRLQHLVLRETETGDEEAVPAAAVFVMIGADPRTDWLPDSVRRDPWGYVLTGDDVPVGSHLPARGRLLLETSLPGVFAVGDVRHGSVKRVASAVGEGAVAVSQVHRYLAEREPSGSRPSTRRGPARRPAG